MGFTPQFITKTSTAPIRAGPTPCASSPGSGSTSFWPARSLSSSSTGSRIKKEKERKEEENQRPRDGKEWADSGPLFEKTVTKKCPYGEIVSGNLYAVGRNAVQWVFLFLCWIAIFLCGSFTASNQLLIAGEVLLLTLVLFVFSVFDPGYFLRPGKGTEAAYSFEKDRLRLVRKKGERVLAKKEFAWEDLIGVKEYDKTYVLVFSTSYLSYAAALPKEGTSIEVHSFLARKMREGKR